MKKVLFTLSLIALAIVFSACEDEVAPLVIPDAFDAGDFNAVTTTQAAVRSQLSSLSSTMKAGRTAGTNVDASDLSTAFTSMSPSLEDITTSYYAGLVNGTDGWLDNIALASGGTYVPGEVSDNGGVFVKYLFDENGIELEQLVEKGLFAAALYNHALVLMNGDLSDGTADQLVSIFGTSPDFPNSDNGDNHANPDIFMAKYTARRDKNDGNGLYTQIKTAFIKLQAAIAAGEDYNEDRDEAIAEIKDLWEKGSAATVINYCQAAISKLSATSPSESDQASALHSYSEAVGFLHGWYQVSEKRITDAEIEEVLGFMNAPKGGIPTSYTFVTDPANQLPKLQQAIDRLKSIYGFTDQQITDFEKNWVNEQSR
jgi:hypothetical protein